MAYTTFDYIRCVVGGKSLYQHNISAVCNFLFPFHTVLVVVFGLKSPYFIHPLITTTIASPFIRYCTY